MTKPKFILLSFLYSAYADYALKIVSYFFSRFGQNLFYFFIFLFFFFFLYDSFFFFFFFFFYFFLFFVTFFYYFFVFQDSLFEETVIYCTSKDFDFLGVFVSSSFNLENFTFVDNITSSLFISDFCDYKFSFKESRK